MKSKRKYKKAFKSIRSSGTKCKENKADIALHRSMGLGQCGEAFPVRPAGPDCETLKLWRGVWSLQESRTQDGGAAEPV